MQAELAGNTTTRPSPTRSGVADVTSKTAIYPHRECCTTRHNTRSRRTHSQDGLPPPSITMTPPRHHGRTRVGIMQELYSSVMSPSALTKSKANHSRQHASVHKREHKLLSASSECRRVAWQGTHRFVASLLASTGKP